MQILYPGLLIVPCATIHETYKAVLRSPVLHTPPELEHVVEQG